MTTGKDWHGNTAYGPAGGNVAAYGMRDAASLARAGMGPMAGSFGNFRTPSGAAMFGGSPVQGQSFTGMNMGQAMSQAMRAQAALEAAKAAQGGLLAPARGPAPSAPYDENVLAVEDVPPPATPNVFNQSYLQSIADFRKAMTAKYGWGAAQPGPGPVAPAAPTTAPSWRNPTAYPQYSTGWKNQTDNYLQGNTYPGGINYTREPGRDNTWSSDDTRYGIDNMARERGY
jgi:hypothetical protein